MAEAPPDEGAGTVDRRTLARRTAAVLAGTAGLLVAPALTATAQARTPGDAIQLGGRNRAGDAQTRLQASPTVATLSILNEHSRTADQYGDVDVVAPQLRLESPVPGAARPQVPDVQSLAAGDLAAAGGVLYFGAEIGDFDVVPSQIFTSRYANYLHPVEPARATILDTRTLTGADRVRLALGGFDPEGRLRADRRIGVDLRPLVNTTGHQPRAAVALSIQILAATASGALTVFPDAEAEAGIEVAGYAVLPAEVTGNGQPFALPASAASIVGCDLEDRLWLSLSSTAHVVLRVTGVFVPDPTAVVEAPQPPENASPYAVRVERQRRALRRLRSTTEGAERVQ